MDEEEAEGWSRRADALFRPGTIASMVACRAALIANKDEMSQLAASMEDRPKEFQVAVVSNLDLMDYVIGSIDMCLPRRSEHDV